MLDIKMSEINYYEEGYIKSNLPTSIKNRLWTEINSTLWINDNVDQIYNKIPAWYQSNINFNLKKDGSNRPDYERLVGKELFQKSPITLRQIAHDLIKTDDFLFFYNYYQYANLLYIDVWNGAEEIPYHCDTINGADTFILIYLTEKNNWQSEWGGQIALKKEIERKTLYENKYSPYDGLMLIVNNANPLVKHQVTSLHNSNVNRYTFSFYYKWN
tara:strand:+ start:5282 stop:5926 length:645 start_codon:yes stop_codon:yes gene_type:complete